MRHQQMWLAHNACIVAVCICVAGFLANGRQYVWGVLGAQKYAGPVWLAVGCRSYAEHQPGPQLVLSGDSSPVGGASSMLLLGWQAPLPSVLGETQQMCLQQQQPLLLLLVMLLLLLEV
jgi:hypothetical protein